MFVTKLRRTGWVVILAIVLWGCSPESGNAPPDSSVDPTETAMAAEKLKSAKLRGEHGRWSEETVQWLQNHFPAMVQNLTPKNCTLVLQVLNEMDQADVVSHLIRELNRPAGDRRSLVALLLYVYSSGTHPLARSLLFRNPYDYHLTWSGINTAGLGSVKKDFPEEMETGEKDNWERMSAAEKWGILRTFLSRKSNSSFTVKDSPPLHGAVRRGDKKLVKRILREGTDPNMKDAFGCTPLHVAARWNHADITRILIDSGGKYTIQDGYYGWSPVHEAAANGSGRSLKVILKTRSTPFDEVAYHGVTPLGIAIITDAKRIARILIQHGWLRAGRWNSNLGVLNWAAGKGYSDIVSLVLAKKDENRVVKRLIDHPDRYGWRPLHEAAKTGHANIAMELLQAGASTNRRTKFRGYVPLHVAARHNTSKVVKALLHHGADISVESYSGQTPLHLAAEGGAVESAKILLNHGAKADAENEDGQTPADVARDSKQQSGGGSHADAPAEKGYRKLIRLLPGDRKKENAHARDKDRDDSTSRSPENNVQESPPTPGEENSRRLQWSLPRAFNSQLPLTVYVGQEGKLGEVKIKEVGKTPADKPLKIPAGRWWYVSPRKDVDWNRLVKEIRENQIRGLDAPRQTDDEDLSHFRQNLPLLRLSLNGTQVTNNGLQHLSGLTNLQQLFLGGTEIGDAGLRHLQRLKNLRRLYLNRSITNEGLRHVARLTNLEDLYLHAEITDPGLKRLENLQNLRRLYLGGEISDVGLRHISRLSGLRRLDINGTEVTDKGLAHLSQLKELRRLFLGATGVTDEGLRHLENLKHLKIVGLDFTEITGSGLKHFAGLDNLRLLFLCSTPLNDAGMKHLSNISSLRGVYLNFTKISDKGLSHLENMEGLNQLYLDHTNITDSGLRYVGELESLRVLSLNDTKVTDKGLLRLSGLQKLNKIYLTPEYVTKKGVKALTKSLPELQVLTGGSPPNFEKRQ